MIAQLSQLSLIDVNIVQSPESGPHSRHLGVEEDRLARKLDEELPG